MKTYKGQISLELIMLILAVVLCLVMIGIAFLNNSSITSVEYTKEVILRGFI